jgi:hypothetical protein
MQNTRETLNSLVLLTTLKNNTVVLILVILAVVGIRVKIGASGRGFVKLLNSAGLRVGFGRDDGEVYGVKVVVFSAAVGELKLHPYSLGALSICFGANLLDGVNGYRGVRNRDTGSNFVAEYSQGPDDVSYEVILDMMNLLRVDKNIYSLFHQLLGVAINAFAFGATGLLTRIRGEQS